MLPRGLGVSARCIGKQLGKRSEADCAGGVAVIWGQA
jgi:hypothetical protein